MRADACRPAPRQSSWRRAVLAPATPSSASPRPLRRRRWPAYRVCSSLACALLALAAAARGVDAQRTGASASSSAAGAAASTVLVNATATPYTLTDLRPVESSLDVNSDSGAFFALLPPSSGAGGNATAYVTLAACGGPEIYPPAGTVSQSAIDATFLTLVVSTDSTNTRPQPGSKGTQEVVAIGGFAAQVIPSGNAPDGVWIGVYPPRETYNVTGALTFEVTASYNSPPLGYTYAGSYDLSAAGDPVYLLGLDDTDRAGAILSAVAQAPITGAPPSTGIIFSKTEQAPAPYFNSSACAVRNAYTTYLASVPQAERAAAVQRNLTARGVPAGAGAQRTQFTLAGLQPGTNYTAWLTSDPAYPPASPNFFYGPAVKFATKQNANCRLVSDLPFCPDVAYATAIRPGATTASALESINATVSPTVANFTKTLGTFPCGSAEFGMYSYIATCDDCTAAYQRWLCAVAIPRCVDPPANPFAGSAASQNGTDLTGAVTGPNTDLLPYVITHAPDEPTRLNTSVGTFQGSWGELLPCLGVCNLVDIMCPPLMQWVCPFWDITAQRDYGTWADANAYGFGQGDNGGNGPDGQRWGGIQRYIAGDAFGNQYCNALGTDLFLRQNNRAAGLAATLPAFASLTASTGLAVILCIFL